MTNTVRLATFTFGACLGAMLMKMWVIAAALAIAAHLLLMKDARQL